MHQLPGRKNRVSQHVEGRYWLINEKKHAKMKKGEPKYGPTKSCCCLQPSTALVFLFIISSQFFVIFSVASNNNNNNNQKSDDEQLDGSQKLEAPDGSRTILEVLNNLPPPKLDQDEFNSEVVRPHKDMLEKFPQHPDMVLKKVSEAVELELNKSSLLLSEVAKVRKVFGLEKKTETNETSGVIDHLKEFFHLRKLQSLSSEEGEREKYSQSLPKCPESSPLLLGPLIVEQANVPDFTPGSKEFSDWFGNVQHGGSYKPSDCEARQKVAIIVPYRDRSWHLRVFLHHIHPFLQRQQLEYQIFVVEQAGTSAFNRGALMNVGYTEASKEGAFTCFVLHDVDLVPEDDRNLYNCHKDTAVHLAVAVNKWKYRLTYLGYFGGVTALSKEQFQKSNGFANSFYGWGGEDDDLYHRVVVQHKFPVFRFPANIARYSMLKHKKEETSENIETQMEKSKKNMLLEDGLTTLQYRKLNERKHPLYTWYLVKLPEPPQREEKPLWSKFETVVWGGMNSIAGSFAAKVAKEAHNFAYKHEEDAEKEANHVY